MTHVYFSPASFRATFVLAAVLFFSTLATAVLSVQDFTCNGGLLNVQTGVPFNCVAVIFNDDLQADASLSSVTLSSLEGWTSLTSYSGTFSGNSVARGSSTSVTFSGIVANSPGTGKKFSDVLINGGSGNAAKLADAALNILSIKTSSASASSSTVSINSEFDVVATINLGGQANLTAEIGLTGCTLSAGQAAAKNFGIVSDSIQSTSWKVTQSSASGSSCSVTVEFRAVADPVTLTNTKTTSVAGSGTAASSPTTTPSSSTTSTGTTGSASSGSASSSASAGTARGSGGGASSRSNELFPIYGLPKLFDQVVPGEESSTTVIVSSFYTGYLRYVNVTLSGIPEDWYTIKAPSVIGPISNTSFEIQWRVPSDARGTYPAVLTISGVGTKNAGIFKATHAFELVLPPAEPVQGQNGARSEPVPTNTAVQSSIPFLPPLSPADVTNFSIVGFAIFIGVILLVIHYQFTHPVKEDEQSNPLPKKEVEDSNGSSKNKERKQAKSKKKK